MKIKLLCQISLLLMICISNNIILKTYKSEFVPAYFNSEKLIQKKYRCIRYFAEKEFDKYTQTNCISHMHDYVNFNLEKSQFLYMFYMHNILMVVIYIFIWIM